VRPLRPDFVFMTGWDAVLVPMLLAGCQGGTHATSGIVPELTRAIYDLTLAGRIKEAYRLQYQLLNLFDTIFAAGDFPEGFRLATGLRGFQFGAGRQPLTPEQHAKLAAARDRIDSQIGEILTAVERYPVGPAARS
jgi:dihydrodipicolinate synthase/N-acetylneuraminate lyase